MRGDAARNSHPVWPRRPAHSRKFVAAGDCSRVETERLTLGIATPQIPGMRLTELNSDVHCVEGGQWAQSIRYLRIARHPSGTSADAHKLIANEATSLPA